MPRTAKNVLVVDDDASVRALLQTLLESEGYGVRLAEDGVGALKELRTHLPDAVVLDLRMPGLSGHEVLALIRSDAGAPDLPVVMLTGAEGDGDAWRAWSEGVDYYVTKPFEPADLLRYLDYLLHRDAEAVLDEAAARPLIAG